MKSKGDRRQQQQCPGEWAEAGVRPPPPSLLQILSHPSHPTPAHLAPVPGVHSTMTWAGRGGAPARASTARPTHPARSAGRGGGGSPTSPPPRHAALRLPAARALWVRSSLPLGYQLLQLLPLPPPLLPPQLSLPLPLRSPLPPLHPAYRGARARGGEEWEAVVGESLPRRRPPPSGQTTPPPGAQAAVGGGGRRRGKHHQARTEKG